MMSHFSNNHFLLHIQIGVGLHEILHFIILVPHKVLINEVGIMMKVDVVLLGHAEVLLERDYFFLQIDKW